MDNMAMDLLRVAKTLEKTHAQIQQQEQQIQQLQDLLLRAGIYVLATAKPEYELHPGKELAQVLLNDINKVLHER